MQGLRQHLEASHDMFDYQFYYSSTGVPMVDVRCPESMYDSDNEFHMPESETYQDPVNKVGVLGPRWLLRHLLLARVGVMVHC